MRITLSVLLFLLCAANSSQSREYRAEAEDFRIVNGKLYNSMLSTNWVAFPRTGASRLRFLRVLESGAICEEDRVYSDGDMQCCIKVFIKNLPRRETLATHAPVIQMLLMRIGTIRYNGETIDAYDYGLPNTPENRKLLKP